MTQPKVLSIRQAAYLLLIGVVVLVVGYGIGTTTHPQVYVNINNNNFTGLQSSLRGGGYPSTSQTPQISCSPMPAGSGIYPTANGIFNCTMNGYFFTRGETNPANSIKVVVRP